MTGIRKREPRIQTMAHTTLASAVLLGLGLLGSSPAAADSMRAPGTGASPRPPLVTPVSPPVVDYTHQHSVGTDAFMSLLGAYRTVISAVDGDRCSMAPTCSVYSHQALRKHGVLLGILLTADRLIHEADSPAHAPKIVEGGETYFADPLEANTYWMWPD